MDERFSGLDDDRVSSKARMKFAIKHTAQHIVCYGPLSSFWDKHCRIWKLNLPLLI